MDLSSSLAYPPGLGSRTHLSVFLLSSHWVRRFFIVRSFEFPPPFLFKVSQAFSQQFWRFGFSSLRFFQSPSTTTYKLQLCHTRSSFVLHARRSSHPRGEAIVMTWAHDLLHDVAYSFHPQCDLILTRPTNSAHLFKRYHPQTYWASAYEEC